MSKMNRIAALFIVDRVLEKRAGNGWAGGFVCIFSCYFPRKTMGLISRNMRGFSFTFQPIYNAYVLRDRFDFNLSLKK